MDWKQAAAQLRTDPDTMQRMAESPDGQALMALMQQQNGSQLQKPWNRARAPALPRWRRC